MSNYKALIGLEMHCEISETNTKAFSRAKNSYEDIPNVNVLPLDMAFPGTMPIVNKEAVRNAIRVAHALHMQIDHELWFDRKNYFYSDLPKGYQITQQDRPIGKEGYLEIEVNGTKKKCEIERIHMEEDTCMQHHFSSYSLLDYNRAGIPLIEIVSKPVLRSGLEARKYVEKIREIVTFANVSDGKMEEGSLRCDVNISIRPYGVETFGTKVEIKNVYGDDLLSSNIVGLIGVPVDIKLNEEFEEATLTFYYDKNKLGNTKESDLAVLWYDEENCKSDRW